MQPQEPPADAAESEEQARRHAARHAVRPRLTTVDVALEHQLPEGGRVGRAARRRSGAHRPSRLRRGTARDPRSRAPAGLRRGDASSRARMWRRAVRPPRRTGRRRAVVSARCRPRHGTRCRSWPIRPSATGRDAGRRRGDPATSPTSCQATTAHRRTLRPQRCGIARPRSRRTARAAPSRCRPHRGRCRTDGVASGGRGWPMTSRDE